MIVKAKNKADLKQQLDAGCLIEEPMPWGANGYRSENVKPGFNAPVCLDPDTRRRFAQITKLADGTWRVK